MQKLLWIYLLWALTLSACAQTPTREAPASQVSRVENRQFTDALAEMLDRIDRLQREVQLLRGDTEQIRHELDRVQERQQSLYLDLDKRLLDLEKAGTEAAAPPTSNLPPSATAGNVQAPAAPPSPSSGSDRVPAESPPLQSNPPENNPGDVAAGEQAAGEPDGQDTNRPVDQGVSGPADQARGEPGTQMASKPEKPAGGTSGKEESIYQEAFVYLNNGRYDDAIADFSRLIESFPNGEYADNAQYWLGETYYVKREFETARANFNQVREKYPDSNKVPDAMLKLGYIEYEESNWKAAREVLNSLIQEYPDSNAAQLARDRLARMRKEGH